jgi:hypothetical protein
MGALRGRSPCPQKILKILNLILILKTLILGEIIMKKTIKTAIILTTLTLMTIGCNDVAIGTDKSGPADAFLNRINDDRDDVATYGLNITINPLNSGTVGQLPLPANEDGTYNDGTLVTLQAKPVEGTKYVFSEWTGSGLPSDINRANATISVTMNTNRMITANFKLHPLILNENEAWTNTAISQQAGLIFYANGTYRQIIRNEPSGPWDTFGPIYQWSVEGEDVLFLEGVRHEYDIRGTSLFLVSEARSTNYSIREVELNGN